MKRQIEPIPTSYRDHMHPIHYLHTGDTRLHKPYADKNGIHCAGDRFGYVVDWEITEKKSESTPPRQIVH